MAESLDSYSDIEDTEDDIGSELFHKATEHAKTLVAKLDSNKLLELYKYYKQATEGSCNIPRPRFFELQAKVKWDAWNSLGNMSRNEAKQHYIQTITELDPHFQTNLKTASWVAVSSHVNHDDNISDSDKTVFDHVKENNLQQLTTVISANSEVLALTDDDGMGLIHWAADRGDGDILKYLIKMGINVNMKDRDGQTALHYAVSCDHVDCVRLLVEAKAEINVKDEDGTFPRDLTSDPKVLELL